MSGVINSIAIWGLIIAICGTDLYARFGNRVFPTSRSEHFQHYTISKGIFVDGAPCRADAINNPLLTAKQRAQQCR
jgi:hypothetical protein